MATGIQKAHSSVLSDAIAQGFQSFVDQSTLMSPTTIAGSPTAGFFWSSIINRAKIPDLAKDLSVNFGTGFRILTQFLNEAPGEFGPGGEKIHSVVGDDRGLVRFIGNWSHIGENASSDGGYITSTAGGDMVEVTFYGTGLHLLGYPAGSSRDIRVTIDGGTESGNILPSSNSSILASRNYALNAPIQAATNLALGVHTARLRFVSGPNMLIYGFEVITAVGSSLTVNPGIAFINGQKTALLAQQTIAYDSGFESGTLGAKGGRAAVYLKQDGTLAKAVTAADTTAKYISNADHANEEIIKAIYFKEFNAKRTDDFANINSVGNGTFTLEDGTTTVTCQQVLISDSVGVEMRTQGTSHITITFVGTGLDLTRNDDSVTVNPTECWVDGVNQGMLPTTGYDGAKLRIQKICSGLPFGCHTVQLFQPSGTFVGRNRFQKMIVYAPKKPTIPSDAIELADYGIMADSAAAGAGSYGVNQLMISPGSIRKMGSREMTFVGTWTNPLGNRDIYYSTAFGWRTSSAGDFVEMPFFGTGVEISLTQVSLATGGTVQIDGANYTGAATVLGNGTWTPGTSTLSNVSGNGVKLRITGLSLGMHKIRFTKNADGNGIEFHCFDVITPVYSMKVNPRDCGLNGDLGVFGVGDTRKLTAIKSASTFKAFDRNGTGNTQSTSSTGFVIMNGGQVFLKTNGGRIRIVAMVEIGGGGSNAATIVYNINGFSQINDFRGPGLAGGVDSTVTIDNVQELPAGMYNIQLFWAATGGSINSTRMMFLAIEE